MHGECMYLESINFNISVFTSNISRYANTNVPPTAIDVAGISKCRVCTPSSFVVSIDSFVCGSVVGIAVPLFLKTYVIFVHRDGLFTAW